MSEIKLDAVISVLLSNIPYKTDDEKELLDLLWPTYRNEGLNEHAENLRKAICILSDWPKWAPLIEAAGKVDRKECLDNLDNWKCTIEEEWSELSGPEYESFDQIRALLSAIPETRQETRHDGAIPKTEKASEKAKEVSDAGR